MKIENNIFKNLAKDFTKAVKEYRAALKNSVDSIELRGVEYWREIMRAKIEIISAVLGFSGMQDFHSFLDKMDREMGDQLKRASAFDAHADGIGGWFS